MSPKKLAMDQSWSAVRWFAYAGAALTITAAVGTFGMAWLVRAERQPQSAFLPLNGPKVAARSAGDTDMEATGSIGPVADRSRHPLGHDVETSPND